MPGTHMTAARVAPAAAALAAGAAGLAAVVLYAGAQPGGPRLRFADLVVGILFPAAAIVVLRRDAGNKAGWLMTTTAVVAAGPLLNQLAWHLKGPGHTVRPAGQAALWLANWIWAPYLLLPTVLVLLLPDGRLPGPRWTVVARAACACTAVAAVAAMFRPGSSDQIASLDNPLGIGAAGFLGPVEALGAGIVVVILAPLCIAGLFLRQRRAAGRERAQLQWLATGAVGAAAAFAASALVPWPGGEVLLAAGLAAVPAAIAAAAWRHQLYDVEVVLNRAVASLLLTVLAVAVYAVLVVAAGTRLAPAAAAVAAIVATALFSRFQRLTQRLLFGVRDQPYAVVERLGDSLDAAAAPVQAVEVLVQTVRDALRLPYLAVTAADPVLAPVVAGRPVAGVDTLACVAHGRTIAELAVGYRHHGERWRPEERSLLAETARRAAALVQLAVVLRDLESARNRVVAAREEERRRLRRELHDGIASALSGISLQLDCLGDDIPAQNAIVLDRIRQRTAEVAAEVRQLVDELRPPALEALGLTDAVREHAHMWEHDGGLMVRITAGQLPPLPASTELAAYRIATEAVTNAGRHARARRCEVRLSADPPWLVIEVTDDGIGFTEPQAGVGLSAMRERAAETGGNLSLSSVPGQGTRMTARLPLEAI